MSDNPASLHRTIVCIASLVLAPAVGAQQIVIDANTLEVRQGGTSVLGYRHSDVPFKPYVKELFTPGGVNVLLDAPPDHLHHHGLMFACAVDKVDFWGEASAQTDVHFEALSGVQQHLRFDGVGIIRPRGHPWANVVETVRWMSGANRHLLTEYRFVTAGRLEKPQVTLLTWESRLCVPPGKASVTLSGSHYHGLGLRFVRSMDAKGEFRNPDNDRGVIFRGEERLARSRWCAYTARADGKTVTVAMFDSPDNPRHPATWFMMAQPFAYLSATLRLHEEPLKVLPDKHLTLKYAVALWDGRPEVAQIDELYQRWTTLSHDVIKP